MKGQDHPEVKKVLRETIVEDGASKMGGSTKAACEKAFLSAIRKLQARAQENEGDAVTDIVSITGEKLTESATTYRCLERFFHVSVDLKAKIVTLE